MRRGIRGAQVRCILGVAVPGSRGRAPGMLGCMDRAGLGGALNNYRARLRPEDVGMPAGLRRRVPGLRREEVAALAGISVDYLVRLEQGRGSTPSDQVLGALAPRAATLRRRARPPVQPRGLGAPAPRPHRRHTAVCDAAPAGPDHRSARASHRCEGRHPRVERARHRAARRLLRLAAWRTQRHVAALPGHRGTGRD